MSNTSYDIAMIRGDGIGPELCESTVKVVEACGVNIRWHDAPMGKTATESHGHCLPVESLETVRRHRYALKAPLIAEKISGGVRVEDDKGNRHYPSVNNAVRRELLTYANVRPVVGFEGVSGKYREMDLVIVREVSEGIYIGMEEERGEDTGWTIKQTTRSGSERIGRFAFDYAKRSGRKKVTACHKANVLHKTDGLFLSTVRDIHCEFLAIDFEDLMIDAACYHLIKNPVSFDVAVMPNQYGDIFSDVAAGLVGSMGLAPGANIGDDYAFFEASHGAAPDIAGKGIVNPVSLILSAALLMEHLEENDAALRVRRAVSAALGQQRFHTPDLGGRATTSELTDAICINLEDGK